MIGHTHREIVRKLSKYTVQCILNEWLMTPNAEIEQERESFVRDPHLSAFGFTPIYIHLIHRMQNASSIKCLKET